MQRCPKGKRGKNIREEHIGYFQEEFLKKENKSSIKYLHTVVV